MCQGEDMPALSLAVISGKGGVGKSGISLGIGLALARAGRQVLLVDCDMGLANLDVLLGLAPEHTLQDVLAGSVPVDEACLPVTDGLRILPSASGVRLPEEDAAELCTSLARALESLQETPDYIILDLGAGISKGILTLAKACRQRLVVATPEPTSLTDAYALMKVLHTEGTTEFSCVINAAMDEEEAEFARERLTGACEAFLNITPAFLGTIPWDSRVPESVCSQTPLLLYAPECPAAQATEALAQRIDAARSILEAQGAIGNEPLTCPGATV